jgi:hypothetical protein
MQFPNILNNVKRGEKRRGEKKIKPEGENKEVKDTTHITGKIDKYFWF